MGEEKIIAHCAKQVNDSKNRIAEFKEKLRIEEEETLAHWQKRLYLARNGEEELR